MKFGKRLETEAYAPYKSFYIQYKELKKALKVYTGQEKDQATVQEVTHWTSSFLRLGPNPEVPPEARLNDTLETELKRVSKFVALQEDGLRSQLSRLEGEVKALVEGGNKDSLLQRLDELGEQLVQVKLFVDLNFTGFRKILKKYDKWSKSAVLAWFIGKVMRAPLMRVDYEGLLATFNKIAMVLGGASLPKLTSREEAAAPHSQMALLLSRKETMRVKVQLARHLEMEPPATASVAAAAAAATAGSRPQRPKSTSCHFDTKDYSLYGGFVAEVSNEKATESGNLTKQMPSCGLFHLREDSQDDLRLVRTSLRSMCSAEIPLTRSEVAQAVKGQYVATPEAVGRLRSSSNVSAEAILGEFRAAVQGGLKPVVQTTAHRSTFYTAGMPIVAALEEEIKMTPAQEWGAPPSPGVMDFAPFNVLLISGPLQELPEWLRCILDLQEVMQVAGFSLGLHAVARCYGRETALPLPHWYRAVMDQFDYADEEEKQSEGYSEESGPKLKPPKAARPHLDSTASDMSVTFKAGTTGARLLHDFGPDQTEATLSVSPEDAETTPAQDTSSLSASLLARPAAPAAKTTAKAAKPVRGAIVTVQPKTLYSNERTFLEWVHFGTIFAALGLGLMHGSPQAMGVAIGRGLVVMAIFVVLWSLNVFHWRANALDKKEIRDYHDLVGPHVLIFGMLAALLASSLHAIELL